MNNRFYGLLNITLRDNQKIKDPSAPGLMLNFNPGPSFLIRTYLSKNYNISISPFALSGSLSVCLHMYFLCAIYKIIWQITVYKTFYRNHAYIAKQNWSRVQSSATNAVSHKQHPSMGSPCSVLHMQHLGWMQHIQVSLLDRVFIIRGRCLGACLITINSLACMEVRWVSRYTPTSQNNYFKFLKYLKFY